MERVILQVTGPERVEFLQGLVTNRIGDAPCYAALLTPQGKYLADFLIVPRGDALLLDVDSGLADDLLRRLSMYKLRSKVDVAGSDLKVMRGTGDLPKGAVIDTRHDALGWRLYGDQGGDDGTDWDAIRVAHCIPQSGIELIPNDTFILEAGFERLHGVDFRKGCFVGQEVTARMKHKTELRKGLRTVLIQGSAPVGTPILKDEREIGTLYTQSGGQAIAQLRFDRVGPGMTAGEAEIHVP
ncbi:folate-binding protein (plasmid) [Paracoccus sp. TK19116]|uniref:Folate-binding protein n=1 Tax=Paracoccus albicereus TaxID=2922394 RepID=A0ABT1MLF7_9RHOB|nr:folate-binding protein [Paracoccus albicereus]MCQ0969134.1 folate-binding protein [Paracoccus albicereus]